MVSRLVGLHKDIPPPRLLLDFNVYEYDCCHADVVLVQCIETKQLVELKGASGPEIGQPFG